jgi:hypothetical protein
MLMGYMDLKCIRVWVGAYQTQSPIKNFFGGTPHALKRLKENFKTFGKSISDKKDDGVLMTVS